MLKLDRYVSELTGKPVISYISDDNYSLKQFRLSPIYWLNRFILRKNMRKTFKFYDLTYTMTTEQLEECKKAFGCNIKILKKGGKFYRNSTKNKTINNPIRLIYAGGIYLGRWRTLTKLAKIIRKLNRNGKKFLLEIYTGNELSIKQKKILNDGENSIIHGLVSQEELKEIYNTSDIALHVEGLDLKNKLTTRISFSTKIIDVLDSSGAVMAIAWKKHSGYTYLNKKDIAICINSTRKIENELIKIYNNKEIINNYANKAWEYGNKNHQIKHIQENLIEDFKLISEGK